MAIFYVLFNKCIVGNESEHGIDVLIQSDPWDVLWRLFVLIVIVVVLSDVVESANLFLIFKVLGRCFGNGEVQEWLVSFQILHGQSLGSIADPGVFLSLSIQWIVPSLYSHYCVRSKVVLHLL